MQLSELSNYYPCLSVAKLIFSVKEEGIFNVEG